MWMGPFAYGRAAVTRRLLEGTVEENDRGAVIDFDYWQNSRESSRRESSAGDLDIALSESLHQNDLFLKRFESLYRDWKGV
jgi:hypothetical protein